MEEFEERWSNKACIIHDIYGKIRPDKGKIITLNGMS